MWLAIGHQVLLAQKPITISIHLSGVRRMLPFPRLGTCANASSKSLPMSLGPQPADLDLCTLHAPPARTRCSGDIPLNLEDLSVSQLFVSRARTASTCFYCNSMSDDRTRIEGRTVGCLTCFWLSLPALDQPSTTNTDTCSERPCAHTFFAHFAEIAVRSHPSIA